MNTLIIMRGPSGCGKSSYISDNFSDFYCFSADEFFETEDKYEFNPCFLPQAHNWCFNGFLTAIENNLKNIIIDNTNIHLWEFYNYIKVGQMHGYDVQVIEIVPETTEELKICVSRNVHQVPFEIICRMALNFERYDGAKREKMKY
jgi:predicted kinase